MSHLRLSLIVAALLMHAHVQVLAQDAPSFKDAIRKFADARKAIATYELLLTINERGRPQRATDGILYPAVNEPVVTLEIAADLKSDRLLVAEHQINDGKKVLKRLDVRTPKYSISVRDSRGSIMPPGNHRIDGYFDPLALGIAAIGDMNRGTSLADVVRNYMDWPSLESQLLADGIIQYGEDDGETSYLLFLDAKRGYSPIRLRDSTGHGGVFRVDQLSSLRDGIWLPASAIVEEPERIRIMQFEWRTVNSSIDERFDLPEIEATYDIDLIDKR